MLAKFVLYKAPQPYMVISFESNFLERAKQMEKTIRVEITCYYIDNGGDHKKPTFVSDCSSGTLKVEHPDIERISKALAEDELLLDANKTPTDTSSPDSSGDDGAVAKETDHLLGGVRPGS